MSSQKRNTRACNRYRIRFWLFLLFFGLNFAKVHSQNMFDPSPLSVMACQADTMDDFYKLHHVGSRVDSVFYKDELFSVSTSEMNTEGIVLNYTFSHLLDSHSICHVKKINVDKEGLIVEFTSFTISDKDTSVFLHKKLLSRNEKGAAEMVWYSESVTDTLRQKNFDLPMIGYRYLSTRANKYWFLTYATDNYLKYSYNDTGGLISSYQVAIHNGDTLFKQKINLCSPDNQNKFESEEWIYADNKLAAYSKHDRNFQIVESISFTDGKETEHHQYENKYNSDSNLVDVVVYDCLEGKRMREMEIKIDNLEITVIPEFGFETHEHLKNNPYWGINDALPEKSTNDIHTDDEDESGNTPFLKTKKIEGGYWSVEYFSSRYDRIPYKTVWYNPNGLPIQIYYKGQMVEKISYKTY